MNNMRPIYTGSLDRDDGIEEIMAQQVGERSSEALEAEEVLKRVSNAISTIDGVRDQLTDLYRQTRPGTVVENEVGDALQAVRNAMKRLRKAREELIQQPLPGMN